MKPPAEAFAIHEAVDDAMRAGAVQKKAELHQLCELLLHKPPATILEIGVYNGGTMRLWNNLFPDAKLLGIDIKEQRLVKNRGFGELLIGDSHDQRTEKMIRQYFGPRIDFVFIDGDHSFAGVVQDWFVFQGFAPLMAFHDILHHADPGMGVERFWNTVRRSGGPTEFVSDPMDWGGIGVLDYRH